MRFAARFALVLLAGLALAPDTFAGECYRTEPVLEPTDPINYDAPDKIICITPGGSATAKGYIGVSSLASASETVHVPTNQPAELPKLTCEPLGNATLCEAFPQPATYGDLTYSWYASGKATKPYAANPGDSAYQFGCNGTGSGAVWVSVHHGTATTTTGQWSVWCSAL